MFLEDPRGNLTGILRDSIGYFMELYKILNGFYKDVYKVSTRILQCFYSELQRDYTRSLFGNACAPIGILQGFLKGISKGIYN